ncbi:MAG: DUF5035 family protein [Bacteroides sp.]
MKKLLSLLLFSLFLAACSKNDLSPVIQVTDVYVNENKETNFVKMMEAMPELQIGDRVEVALNLRGNGTDLKSFQVNLDEVISLRELIYQKKEVSTEGDFTNVKKGHLRFVDGVKNTTLIIKVVVTAEMQEDMKLLFYLSSKAECDAAQCELVLRTKE